MPPKKKNSSSVMSTGGFYTVSTAEAQQRASQLKEAEKRQQQTNHQPKQNNIKQVISDKYGSATTNIPPKREGFKHTDEFGSTILSDFQAPNSFDSARSYVDYFKPLVMLELEAERLNTQITIDDLQLNWKIQVSARQTNTVASFEMTAEERFEYSLRGGIPVQLSQAISDPEIIAQDIGNALKYELPVPIYEPNEDLEDVRTAQTKTSPAQTAKGAEDGPKTKYLCFTGYIGTLSPLSDTVHVVIDLNDDNAKSEQFLDLVNLTGGWKLQVIFSSIGFCRMFGALRKVSDFNSALLDMFLGRLPKKTIKESKLTTNLASIDVSDTKTDRDWRDKSKVFDKHFLPAEIKNAPTLNSLNPSQTNAIKLALTEPVSTILGPPGTGKTTTLSNLVYHLHAIRKAELKENTDEYYHKQSYLEDPYDLAAMVQKVTTKPLPPPEKPSPILVSAPSNVATDHLAAVLLKIPGLDVLRISSKRYQTVNYVTLDDAVENCALHRRIESWMLQNPDSELAQLNQQLFIGTDTSALAAKLDSIFNDEQFAERRSARDSNTPMHQDPNFILFVQQKLGSTFNMGLKKAKMSDKQKWAMLYYELQTKIIQKADVICSTFALCGNPIIFNKIKLEHVLLDEVSQSTEPQLLLPLAYSPKHLVLFGDRQQLGPLVHSAEAKAKGYHRSLFERLVTTRACPSKMLTVQYRMHPAISKFSAEKFYNRQLEDGVDARARETYLPMFPWPDQTKPICFINTHSKEDFLATSAFNQEDCQVIVRILTNFIRQGVPLSDIGVVVPYRAQSQNIIRQLCAADSSFLETVLTLYSGVNGKSINPYTVSSHHHGFTVDNAKELIETQLEISSVDSFQGKEKPIIIFNPVRTTESSFLSDNRINVAITRAKSAMIIVGGNCNVKNGVFGELIQHYKLKNAIIPFYELDAFWGKFLELVATNIEKKDKAQRDREQQKCKEQLEMASQTLAQRPTILSKSSNKFTPLGYVPNSILPR